MLDGAEDCKWIYQALIHMGSLHHRLTGAFAPQATKENLLAWLDTLIKIDPLRKGRWQDSIAQLQANNSNK